MSKKFSIGGNLEEFEFEHRLFNHLCAYSMLACMLSFTANWVIGLAWQLQTVIGVLFCFVGYLYYTSRIRKKYKAVIIPYHISVGIFLSLMWFFNGGIQGPIGYFYFIAISGIMIFLRHFWIAIGLILINIIVLVILDYFFHDWVIPYQDTFSQYLDTIIGICTVSVLLSLGIYRLKQNYDLEHGKVEEQKQTLSQVNQIQNKLISIISHDVRAPFNSLKGTLSLLKSDVLTQDEIKMLAENLSKEVDNTINLVNNLLYWSQAQLQGINPNPEVFDMATVMEENIQLVKPQAAKKMIRMHSEHIEKTIVYADKEMIKTVLRNLMTNAIKFSYKGGRIETTMQYTDSQIIIGVLDNGVGLNSDQKESLFKPIHHSTLGTANEKGNGLGLTLCKDFVEKNGGRIWVESTQGKGSKFYFSVNLQAVQSL